MAKTKIEVVILDIDKVEEIKRMINELLDTIDTLCACADDDEWTENEAAKKRKEYIDRFAKIIADDEKEK